MTTNDSIPLPDVADQMQKDDKSNQKQADKQQNQSIINQIRSITVQIFENHFSESKSTRTLSKKDNIHSGDKQETLSPTTTTTQFSSKIYGKLYQELYELVPQQEDELPVLLAIEKCLEEVAISGGQMPKQSTAMKQDQNQTKDTTTRSNTRSESHNTLFKIVTKLEKYLVALMRLNYLCVRLLRRQNDALPKNGQSSISTFTDINPFLIKSGVRSLINHIIQPNSALITKQVVILTTMSPPSAVLPIPKQKHSRPISQNDLLLAKLGWILCLVDLIVRYGSANKSTITTETEGDKPSNLFETLIVQPIISQSVTKYAHKLVELLHKSYIENKKSPDQNWTQYQKCVRTHWKVKMSNRFSYFLRQPSETADWYPQLKLWFILFPDLVYSNFKQLYSKTVKDSLFTKLWVTFVHETINKKQLEQIIAHIAVRFNDPTGTALSSQLIQTMFNLLDGVDQEGGQSKDQQINTLLKQIINCFEDKLHRHNEKHKSGSQFMNHVEIVEMFSNFEHNLSTMLTTSLYDNSKCHQFIRKELFRLVNENRENKAEKNKAIAGGGGGGKSRVLTSFSRCLAIYLHHHLSPMHGNDSNDCTKLKQSIRLFRYLKDKTNFESYYRSYLAKRLLAPLAFWLDKERYVIGQLSLEHDLLYTNQLEGMICDLIQSISTKMNFQLILNQERNSQPQNNNNPLIDIRLNILTKHYWSPVVNCENCYPSIAHLLPHSVQGVMKRFETYYQTNFRKRIITFCVKSCWAVVEINLDEEKEYQHRKKLTNKPKPKETNDTDTIKLLITAPQVMILQMLCSSPNGQCSLAQIKSNFKKVFSDSEVFRALKLLIGHKVLARNKDNQTTTKTDDSITERDLITWNGDLSEPLKAISSQVTAAKQSESEPNRSNSILNCTTLKVGSSLEVVSKEINSLKWNKLAETIDDEENNRSCLDAAIVRMMKQRRKVSYRQLIDDISEQLVRQYKRRCKNKFIEQRIDRLIELDYIASETNKDNNAKVDESKDNKTGDDVQTFRPDYIVYTC